MRRSEKRAVWVVLALAGTVAPGAAQMPPYPPPPAVSPEAGEIAHCLCLQEALNALGADMSARRSEYQAIQNELSRLDSDMQRERAGMDVNNPQAVARFRQMLERRDAAFARSNALATGDLGRLTEQYNARAGEYTARCANRPRDPRLLESVRATLSCPPLR